MPYLHSVTGIEVLSGAAMRIRRLSWIIALLGFTLVPVDAQQELAPSFRAQSEVVLVDLVVTDKRGQFVHNLKPEEIQVFEDGKLQRLTFFDLRRRAGSEEQLVSEVRTGAVPAPALASRTLPTTPQDRGYFVFLFDLQAMSFHGLERVKESIRRFARSELAPTDRVMVASIRPQFRVELPFTSDISQLDTTLDQLVARDFEETSIARFVEQLDYAFARMEMGALDTFDPGQGAAGGEQRLDSNLDGAISQAADYGRALMVKIELQMDFTCAAIGALSRHLGSLPGRKQLIYFSNGYPLNAKRTVTHLISQRAITYSPGQITLIHLAANNYMAGASESSHLINRLNSAVRQANRAQVSVYSIDPRGLMVPAISNSEHRGSGNYLYPTYSTEDITAPHQFLASLSMETGGLWYADDNDLERPIRSAYRDGSQYYLLGYVPSSIRKQGKFHKIKVKVKRKGIRLRYREGYVEEDPREAETVDLANAFKFPDLFRDFPVNTQVLNRKGQVQVQARIPTGAFVFRSQGGQNRCVIEMFGALFDDSGKWVGDKFYFAEKIDLDFNQQDLAKFLRYEHFAPVAAGTAPDGPLDLVVVVRQSLTGRMAASTHRIVPN